MDQTDTELPTPRNDNEGIQRPETWITNTHKSPYSPNNIVLQILAEKDFHILIEPNAVDYKGHELPECSAVYVGNPDERKKYKSIFIALTNKPLFMAYYTADFGAFTELYLEKIDLAEEEKKALKALSLKQNITSLQKHGVPDIVEEKQRELDALGTSPYPLQKMRDNISKMIDEILAEHPELKP